MWAASAPSTPPRRRLTTLRFVDGTALGGTLLPARANQARVEEDRGDVTAQIMVGS
ncbi:MAG TPA: hypothetical protein VHE13_10965 [Opitutus sp.]|nr:hypothetical protein [Opitutus sp.]